MKARLCAGLLFVATLAACSRAPKVKTQPTPPAPAPPAESAATLRGPALLPLPASIEQGTGDGFVVTANTVIQFAAADPGVERMASQLAEYIRRGTGILPKVQPAPSVLALETITLRVDPSDRTIASEGYAIEIGPKSISVNAAAPAGVFYAMQTLRQLLPYWSEHEAIMFRQPRPATLPALRIRDSPRYAWRGAMLDVARHFFTVEEVKRFIDLLALHKMNRLHLHLADDQGWRIEIAKWPELTAKGGLTEVGGTPGGFYTKAQYADLVNYAAERFIMIVPEIDMPGHTNAALSSYAQLNCNEQATPVFTGTAVGFSALCIDHEGTYEFIDDVVRELGAMTPGPYFHIGGDEVKTLTPPQYKMFVERVQAIVQKHGKEMIGWDEVAATNLATTSIVQHWRPNAAKEELARAPRLILSPGNRTYLDMKYDNSTALGLNWAGLIPVQMAYDWDPATLVPGARPEAILGVEAPLWSETIANIREAEFLAMPRLAIIAELAWSPASSHDWEQFRVRLGAQSLRWSALGINFYRAPEIPWK